MNSLPLVSICIPSYNTENYIEQTIQSALEQSYGNIEIIICDDNSSDATPEIIGSFEKNNPVIRFIRNDKNIGMVANWNKCVGFCSGKYINILHGDDMYKKDIIVKQVRIMEENPNVGAVFALSDIIDEENIADRFTAIPKELPLNQHYDFDAILNALMINRNIFLVCPSVMMRKTIFEEIGMFNERYKQAVDVDMWLRILQKHKVFIIPERLITSRMSKTHATKKYNEKRTDIDELFEVLDKYISETNCKTNNNLLLVTYKNNKLSDLLLCASSAIYGNDYDRLKLILNNVKKVGIPLYEMRLNNLIKLILIIVFYKLKIIKALFFIMRAKNSIKKSVDI